MTKYKFGFEGGAHGVPVSTSSHGPGDTAWGAVAIGAGATFTHDTTVSALGGTSGKIVGSTAQTVGRWTLPSHMQGRVRIYLKLDALPASNLTFIWLGSASTSQTAQITLLKSGAIVAYGRSTASGSALNSGSTVLTPGGMYEIEMAYSVGTAGTLRLAVHTIDRQTIYDSGTVTVDTGTAGVRWIEVGQYNTSSTPMGTFWIDEAEVDDAATGIEGPTLATLTPVQLTLTVTAPKVRGGTDGTLVASWPPVPGAVRYEASGPMPGEVTDGEVVVENSDATSPLVFTGLPAGMVSVAVQPIP